MNEKEFKERMEYMEMMHNNPSDFDNNKIDFDKIPDPKDIPQWKRDIERFKDKKETTATKDRVSDPTNTDKQQPQPHRDPVLDNLINQLRHQDRMRDDRTERRTRDLMDHANRHNLTDRTQNSVPKDNKLIQRERIVEDWELTEKGLKHKKDIYRKDRLSLLDRVRMV